MYSTSSWSILRLMDTLVVSVSWPLWEVLLFVLGQERSPGNCQTKLVNRPLLQMEVEDIAWPLLRPLPSTESEPRGSSSLAQLSWGCCQPSTWTPGAPHWGYEAWEKRTWYFLNVLCTWGSVNAHKAVKEKQCWCYVNIKSKGLCLYFFQFQTVEYLKPS